jgi:flagellar hook assembly protein FlgD
MFNMDKSGNHLLAVYDVSGRLVKVLSSGQISAGSHVVRWDGTNSLGASVASAVYFYKLRADDTELVKKMVLLR